MSDSSGETPMKKKPVHLLVFPFSPAGHIIPLLDLTRRLLTHHHPHLTVTFIVTPPSLPLLQPLLDTFPPPLLQPLILSPPPPPPASTGLLSRLQGLQLHGLSGPIESWYRAQPDPPDVFVADFFLGWTRSLCANLGLPRVVFYPSGAFGCSIFNSLWRDVPENPDDDPDFEVGFSSVPGSPRFKWCELSILYRIRYTEAPEWENLRRDFAGNVDSWGAVFNSFSEFESAYVEHFRKEMGHDRVWAVGPLLPPAEDQDLAAQRGGASSVPAEEVLTWLDGRPECSVVYVCFGSETALTEEESAALGAALECSGVHFIWCVRGGSDGDVGMTMPDSEYERRLAGRGFVIRGWAPQLAILRHRAVAAFVTHCGWNSVLEAVASGIMMLTWPSGKDQYTNAQLIVDQMGLGLRVKRHGPAHVPYPDELTQLLVDSVSPDRPERSRVMRLREAAAAAVNGGSTTADLDGFVERLSQLKK